MAFANSEVNRVLVVLLLTEVFDVGIARVELLPIAGIRADTIFSVVRLQRCTQSAKHSPLEKFPEAALPQDELKSFGDCAD